MKKIKLLIIPILLLLVCGCVVIEETNAENNQRKVSSQFEVYIDDYTCVEYFASYTERNITPRYNANGTLRLNERCLNEKDN